MAVNRNDAQRIIDKYFRLPSVHPGGRKYYFPVNEVTPSNFKDLHVQLGSHIKKDEIISFINQEDWETKEPFIRFPLRYMVPGEVIATDLDLNGERVYFFAVKLSHNHYLTNKGEIINIDDQEICEEQNRSPFIPDAKVMNVALLKPSNNFRLIDQVFLTEKYPETKPENVLNVYSLLRDIYIGNKVSSRWEEIVISASEAGISLFTIFKILEIFLISNLDSQY